VAQCARHQSVMFLQLFMALVLLLEGGPYGHHLVFEKNKGQAPADVRYLLHTHEYHVDFKRGEMVFHLGSKDLRVRFDGRLNKKVPEGHARIDGLVRYLDADSAVDVDDIPKFSSVKYESLYAGIDLSCYGRDGQLECDFIALSGADPSQIRVDLDGAERLEVDEAGSLVITVGGQPLHIRKPIAFQLQHGERTPVEIRYQLMDPHEVGFAVGEYNRSIPLIIDPR